MPPQAIRGYDHEYHLFRNNILYSGINFITKISRNMNPYVQDKVENKIVNEINNKLCNDTDSTWGAAHLLSDTIKQFRL